MGEVIAFIIGALGGAGGMFWFARERIKLLRARLKTATNVITALEGGDKDALARALGADRKQRAIRGGGVTGEATRVALGMALALLEDVRHDVVKSREQRVDVDPTLRGMKSSHRMNLALQRAKQGLPPNDDLKGMKSSHVMIVMAARDKANAGSRG
jgi:hypothetical protein